MDEQIFIVQLMDDEIHTYFKNTRPEHGRGNEYITKTIQHVDEEKVNKFKDVMRNCYPVMLFRRRIKTGVRIKIAPMDEKELVLKKNSCSHKQKKKKELIKLFKGGLQGVQTP